MAELMPAVFALVSVKRHIQELLRRRAAFHMKITGAKVTNENLGVKAICAFEGC
jgi:hypothetical protein